MFVLGLVLLGLSLLPALALAALWLVFGPCVWWGGAERQ